MQTFALRGRLAPSALLGPLVFIAALMVGFTSASAFAGEYHQDGRESNAVNVDGGSAYIEGDSFNPASGDCVIYSISVMDKQAPRQVETGILRCDNNGAIDNGSCPGGYRFAERWDGTDTGYYCHPGGAFTNGDLVFASIVRSGSTTTMSGTIGSASISQPSFALTHTTVDRAWGETTSGGNATCPSGTAQGAFTIWNKYVNGNWTTISNAGVYHYGTGVAGPCWTVGVQDSNGGFHVW